MTLQQYLLKHNRRIKHHDRLFYGKYAYSQRVLLPIAHFHRMIDPIDLTNMDRYIDVDSMGVNYHTMRMIDTLRKSAKKAQHPIKLRKEGAIMHLYSNDLEYIDRYIGELQQLFEDQCSVAELSCAPPVDNKNVRVRKDLPHGRFRSEVVLRTWNFGTKTAASVEAVTKFYNTYQGSVWNKELEMNGKVNYYTYTSLWLEDPSLVPVCYLVFGEAVQKVVSYKLQSEMEQ